MIGPGQVGWVGGGGGRGGVEMTSQLSHQLDAFNISTSKAKTYLDIPSQFFRGHIKAVKFFLLLFLNHLKKVWIGFVIA